MAQGNADRDVAQARQALQRGDFPRAARIAEQVVRARPGEAAAWFVLGMALAETGHLGHALAQVERAVALAPDSAEFRAQQARLLIMLRRDAEARAAIELAHPGAGDPPLVYDTIGCVLARLGEHGPALALFERAVAAEPDTLSFRFNYASSLGFFGEVAQARAQYEAMIARDPANGAAHLGLAGLGGGNDIARIEAAIADARDHEERVRLHYAAAKAHEDLGQAPAVWHHLDSANRAHRARIGYRAETDAALVQALQQAFADPGYFAGPGLDQARPLFVVGLPRTGTTLVERILAAHPAVRSLGELQAMPLAVKRLSGSRTNRVLDVETIAGAGRAAPAAVAQAYLDQVRAQAGADAGLALIDKFPLNFLYLGYIARAFPNARIVCLRRHPLDSVWSNFKHLFATTTPYYGWSYDLMDAARYYALFDALMAQWRRLFPGQVLELGYETLIGDPEGQVRALLAHCGLPWDAACLEFHSAGGAVATPSAQQVRRPLNRDSVGRWQAHAERMAPVVDFLRERGIVV